MNGTRWAIRPATNATSRDRRSSFDTTTLHLALRAAANAAASLRPAVQGVGALPRFRLRVFADDGEALSCREALNGRPLGFYAEARALLSLGGNSKICDSAIH